MLNVQLYSWLMQGRLYWQGFQYLPAWINRPVIMARAMERHGTARYVYNQRAQRDSTSAMATPICTKHVGITFMYFHFPAIDALLSILKTLLLTSVHQAPCQFPDIIEEQKKTKRSKKKKQRKKKQTTSARGAPHFVPFCVIPFRILVLPSIVRKMLTSRRILSLGRRPYCHDSRPVGGEAD